MKTNTENPTARHSARSLAIPAAESPMALAAPALFPGNPFGDLQPEPVLRLNFRGAPLETILNHLRLTAGFIIRVKPSVDSHQTIDLTDDRPLTREGALQALDRALQQIGCTAIQDGRIVTIIRSRDAKKHYIRIPLPELPIRAA